MNRTDQKKLISYIEKMHENFSVKGMEVHRRGYLLKVFELFGFNNYLNDVTQLKKRPDVRFYIPQQDVNKEQPCPFFLETKDINDVKKFDDLPFQQVFTYIYTNSSRLTSFCVCDFVKVYFFKFNSEDPKDLLDIYNLSEMSLNNKIWKKNNCDKRASELLRKYKFGKTISFTDSIENIVDDFELFFNMNILNSYPSWKIGNNQYCEYKSPEDVALELSHTMQPFVHKSLEVIQESEVSSKIFKRFNLWVKQRDRFSGSLAELNLKLRTKAEDEIIDELQNEYAWLSSYSVVNVLYLLRGLEERSLILPVFTNWNGTKPKHFFSNVWDWIDQDGSKFVKDFIRLQKIYCDWLIPKIDDESLSRLITIFKNLPILKYGESDLLGRLYELLMQDLDSTSRKKLGQYYTPRPISELLWKISWDQLKSYNVSANEVTTLDPGAGSGMLLCKGVELLTQVTKPNVGSVGPVVRDLAKTNINGFEINPLSSAIARINLYFTYIDSIHRYGGDPEALFINKVPIVDLPIFNTNSYRVGNPISQELLFHSEVEGEEMEAWKREESFLDRTKNRSDFLLIIGNPPYCGNDSSVNSGIADHLKVWKDGFTLRKPNSGIREALLHYMGLADTLLRKGNKGMIAFVTSDSWLNNYDHEIVRRYFLKNYDWKGVVNLGANMFQDAKVSTCLVFLKLRKQAMTDDEISKVSIPVFQLSVNKSPEDRFLEINEILDGKEIIWNSTFPDKYACVRFTDSDSFTLTKEEEVGFVDLTRIFYFNSPAIKTGSDPLLTSASRKHLAHKIKQIMHTDEKIDLEENISGKEIQKKVPILRKLSTKLNLEFSPLKIKKYYKFNGTKDRYAVPEERNHYIYFEPDLLDRHRLVDTWNPHEGAVKLAFNVFEDPARACIVPADQYLHCWQHMRFAPLVRPEPELLKKEKINYESNLTSEGLYLRSFFDEDIDFLNYVVGCVNSETIQSSFADSLPTREPPIPLISEATKVFARNISDCASVLGKIEPYISKNSLKVNNVQNLIESDLIQFLQVNNIDLGNVDRCYKETQGFLNLNSKTIYEKTKETLLTPEDILVLIEQVEMLELVDTKTQEKKKKKAN